MKKTLLYIIAIPLALIASSILPNYFLKILDYFIPFDVIIDFFDKYLMNVFSGYIAVAFTVLIAPAKKILLGSITLLLNIIAIIYVYTQGAEFNYLFAIGGVLALIIMIISKPFEI